MFKNVTPDPVLSPAGNLLESMVRIYRESILTAIESEEKFMDS